MQKIGDIPNTRADSNGEFTDGNVAAGVPPTILPAEWFNTLQRELIKVVQDGGLALDPNDDTQVLAALKKLFLQSGNNLSEIKAAGPTAVAAALVNLGLGDVAHLPQLTGVVGTSRNAKMSVTTASATATFTADELVVQTALGASQYKLANINKTINLATVGAGGIDKGGVPISGFVALYIIYNPLADISSLLAVNTTSVLAPEICAGAMPANYTASALVSVWPISASKFNVGSLSGRTLSIFQTNVFSSGTPQSTLVSLSISGAVPINAKRIRGRYGITTTAVATHLTIAIVASITPELGMSRLQSSNSSTHTSTYELDLFTPQLIYWMADAGAVLSSSGINIYVTNYTI